MSEMAYRRQLQDFTHVDADLMAFVQAMRESPLPIPEQLGLVLQQDDVETLRHAVCLVGWLQINSLAPALLRLYEVSQDDTLKWRTIEALGSLDDEESLQFLLALLQSREKTQLRIAATYAFQGRKRPATITPLLTIAGRTTENAELRGMAIEALAYQGDASLLPQILPFLQDVEPVVRWDALYTVGELGDASFASFIEPLLTDTSPIHNWASASIAQDARAVLDMWGVILDS